MSAGIALGAMSERVKRDPRIFLITEAAREGDYPSIRWNAELLARSGAVRGRGGGEPVGVDWIWYDVSCRGVDAKFALAEIRFVLRNGDRMANPRECTFDRVIETGHNRRLRSHAIV